MITEFFIDMSRRYVIVQHILVFKVLNCFFGMCKMRFENINFSLKIGKSTGKENGNDV